MFKNCPKCGYTHAPDDMSPDRCPVCGLIYAKWLKRQAKPDPHVKKAKAPTNPSAMQAARNYLLYVMEDLEGPGLYAYTLIYLVFLIWSTTFIFTTPYTPEINGSFMHHINLVFHEAGHVLFMPLGQFLTILGGSLMQLLVPLTVLVAFLIKTHDTFGATIALWWLAQSLLDLVPYIDDAQRQEMWLLGGVRGKDMPGIHDWNNILTTLDILNHHAVATVFVVSGKLLMLLALIWGGMCYGWRIAEKHKETSTVLIEGFINNQPAQPVIAKLKTMLILAHCTGRSQSR